MIRLYYNNNYICTVFIYFYNIIHVSINNNNLNVNTVFFGCVYDIRMYGDLPLLILSYWLRFLRIHYGL